MTRPQPPAPAAPATPAAAPGRSGSGSAGEVFAAFLRLGLTSFGGPVAHLGYFRTEFVERRRWLDDRSFTDLVALCQFLPGPVSSQVGMAVGMARAGWAGSLCAWLGFTAPSAVALILFAFGVARWDALARSGAAQGLKIAALAVVAQAVWSMARALCPDRLRAGLAIFAALVTLALPTAWGQIAAMAVCGAVAWRRLDTPPRPPAASASFGVSRRAGAVALALFAALLVGLPALAAGTGSTVWAVIADFYRAGALVFGGGHVVLPLLQSTVVPGGAVSGSDFLAGYGAAQAVPGPLFSFAAYLGAVMHGPVGGWSGGLLLLVAVFAPAYLLIVGALPWWDALRQRGAIQSALAGINAGVVGILLAALYDPVWTGAVHGRTEFAIALLAFGLLAVARVSPVVVVAGAAAAGGWLLG